MSTDLTRLPPLPEGSDRALVRAAVLEAAEKVAARVVAQPESTRWLGKWKAGALEAVAGQAGMLPTLVAVVFPEDSVEADLTSGLTMVSQFGADRARLRVAQDHTVRLAVHSAREILGLLDAELAPVLSPGEREAVRERIAAALDLCTAEYLVGFLDEAATVAAEQEELSGLLLDSTQAGFALGSPDGTVSVTNKAFLKFFGADADPVGRTWEDVLGLDDLGEIGGEGNRHELWRELTVTDQLGTEHVLRVSLHRRRDRLQAIAVDISLEAEFRGQHQDFVRGLIHDLRSPLAVISGWSHTLVAESARLEVPIRDEALGTINRAARQLTRMSDNLLELTLLEGGSHRLDVELLDAAARLRALGSGYAATIEAPDEAAVMADPDAFERMLTNLLDNAVTHGSPPVQVRLRVAGDSVKVDVVDHGEIDPSVLSAAATGRVAAARGFGLGLRTALLLARAQGGDVELRGIAPTTFTLTLPAAALP